MPGVERRRVLSAPPKTNPGVSKKMNTGCSSQNAEGRGGLHRGEVGMHENARIALQGVVPVGGARGVDQDFDDYLQLLELRVVACNY